MRTKGKWLFYAWSTVMGLWIAGSIVQAIDTLSWATATGSVIAGTVLGILMLLVIWAVIAALIRQHYKNAK